MNALRRFLIVAHRYLGIGLGLLVVMWFATGITMMYVGGMPRLTPELGLERLADIDLSRVQLTPEEAAARAGIERSPGRVSLVSLLDRPVYRFAGRGTTTVFADSGEVLEELPLAQARTIASRFTQVPEERVEYVRTLRQVDQWTLVQGRQLPLYKFSIDDADGTEVYVEAATGEVAMMTTRRSRAFAWISTIPHWMYFTALRLNQPLWYRIVVWTSALVCVLAVLGLALAVVQFVRTRRRRGAVAVPYAGWMRWHYVSGAVFGLFTLTFAFSGLLSMEPFAWTQAVGLQVPRDALTGGPVDLSRFATLDAPAWSSILGGRGIREMEFVRIQDEHYYVVRQAPMPRDPVKRERLHQPYNIAGRAEDNRLLVAADTLTVRTAPFSEASFVKRLEAALPDTPIVETALLSDYDSYYYSRARQTPLPVLRVKFADPGETWVYIDPVMGQVLASVHRLSRVERWLYNGLHSLDFAFWYNSRPLWDIVMIVLCLGGLTTSGLGLMLGIRRVRRGARRLVRAPAALPGERPREETPRVAPTTAR